MVLPEPDVSVTVSPMFNRGGGSLDEHEDEEPYAEVAICSALLLLLGAEVEAEDFCLRAHLHVVSHIFHGKPSNVLS